MPITLTLTEGVLTKDAIQQAIHQITASFLKHHDLSGNKVMTPNVTAHVHVMPKGTTFAGGSPVEGAWIETKTPSFALADARTQISFFGEATQIIHALSEGKLPEERIWSNGVHAVDGTWNMHGIAMNNLALGQAIAMG